MSKTRQRSITRPPPYTCGLLWLSGLCDKLTPWIYICDQIRGMFPFSYYISFSLHCMPPAPRTSSSALTGTCRHCHRGGFTYRGLPHHESACRSQPGLESSRRSIRASLIETTRAASNLATSNLNKKFRVRPHQSSPLSSTVADQQQEDDTLGQVRYQSPYIFIAAGLT